MKLFYKRLVKLSLAFSFLVFCEKGFAQEVPTNQANQSSIECECIAVKTKVWNIGSQQTFNLFDCNCTPNMVEVKLFSRWGTTLATINRFEMRLTDFEQELEAGTYFLSLAYQLKENEVQVKETMSLTVIK